MSTAAAGAGSVAQSTPSSAAIRRAAADDLGFRSAFESSGDERRRCSGSVDCRGEGAFDSLRQRPRPCLQADSRSPLRPPRCRPLWARRRGCASMPASRLSISSVAFSLSRRRARRPARTGSPSAFSQPTNVPSSMFQPRRGTVIGIAMFDTHSATRSRIACTIASTSGTTAALQRRAVRRRRVQPVQPADRGVEVVEAAVRDLGRDLRADAERGERLVHDQQPAGLRHRLQRSSPRRAGRPCAGRSPRPRSLRRPASRRLRALAAPCSASATTVTSRALADDRRLGRTGSRRRPPAPGP